MDIPAQLDNIRIANFNSKLNNELDYLKNVTIMTPFENGHDITPEERIVMLETIIKQPGIYQNTVQQQRDNMFKEIDKYTYKKQWNKLPAFHKTVKLTEYMNDNFKDINSKEKTRLIAELTDHAKNGRINTKKYVIYDPNEEKILSLPCVKTVKTEKGDTYNIDVV